MSARESGLYDPGAAKAPAKVRITTYIDSDVLEKIKAKATRIGVPYQTLLNSELRQLMISENTTSNVSGDEIRKIIREELAKTG